MRQRTRLLINAGNVLEILGAASIVFGSSRLFGVGVAAIVAGVLVVLAAELIYDGHVWRVPLPHRPQVRQRVKARQFQLRMWRARHPISFRSGL